MIPSGATTTVLLVCLALSGRLQTAKAQWLTFETELSVAVGPLREGDLDDPFAASVRVKQTFATYVYVEAESTSFGDMSGNGCPGIEGALCELSRAVTYRTLGVGFQIPAARVRPFVGGSIGRRIDQTGSRRSFSILIGVATHAEFDRMRIYAEYRRRMSAQLEGGTQWAVGVSLRAL